MGTIPRGLSQQAEFSYCVCDRLARPAWSMAASVCVCVCCVRTLMGMKNTSNAEQCNEKNNAQCVCVRVCVSLWGRRSRSGRLLLLLAAVHVCDLFDCLVMLLLLIVVWPVFVCVCGFMCEMSFVKCVCCSPERNSLFFMCSSCSIVYVCPFLIYAALLSHSHSHTHTHPTTTTAIYRSSSPCPWPPSFLFIQSPDTHRHTHHQQPYIPASTSCSPPP